MKASWIIVLSRVTWFHQEFTTIGDWNRKGRITSLMLIISIIYLRVAHNFSVCNADAEANSLIIIRLISLLRSLVNVAKWEETPAKRLWSFVVILTREFAFEMPVLQETEPATKFELYILIHICMRIEEHNRKKKHTQNKMWNHEKAWLTPIKTTK